MHTHTIHGDKRKRFIHASRKKKHKKTRKKPTAENPRQHYLEEKSNCTGDWNIFHTILKSANLIKT